MDLDGPVDGPADIFCKSDLSFHINIHRIDLDGPVDGPDLNLKLKLCDVLYKIVLCFKYRFGQTCGRTCRHFL